ncbi:MAG TPA: hypothetical protein DCY88_21835 [Cyanobacteria bacterium UBA11372]|nr:hypothetical protein [Cyanobacteria bacterium UBA11372]
MKKLLMATAGSVFIALGVTAKAEALTLNGQSLDLPESEEASISFGRFAAMPELAPASAIALGGAWYQFSFGKAGKDAQGCQPADPNGPLCTPSEAGNSVFAGASPWEFEVGAAGAILKVTDAFFRGDAFSIFNFNTLIGTTSTAFQDEEGCGSNPDTCFADPLVSKGTFNLAAGQYSLRIVPTASPFEKGAAFFRLDEAKEVPEPVSVLGLLALGVMGVAHKCKGKPQRQQ